MYVPYVGRGYVCMFKMKMRVDYPFPPFHALQCPSMNALQFRLFHSIERPALTTLTALTQGRAHQEGHRVALTCYRSDKRLPLTALVLPRRLLIALVCLVRHVP